MISPENKIPLDDSSNEETEDQQSQKDLHSNGLEETTDFSTNDEQANADSLKQAYDASEASYTLDAEKGITKKEED